MEFEMVGNLKNNAKRKSRYRASSDCEEIEGKNLSNNIKQ